MLARKTRVGTSVRSKIAVGVVTATGLATGGLAMGGQSAAGASTIPSITGAQVQCLLGQHLDTSLLVQNVSPAQIAQLVAAASTCGITIPPGLLSEIATNLVTLRSDPRITCLGSQGLTLPAPGATPTPADIDSYRAALLTCGLLTPEVRPVAPAPQPRPTSTVAPRKTNRKLVKKAAKTVRKGAKPRTVRPSARRR